MALPVLAEASPHPCTHCCAHLPHTLTLHFFRSAEKKFQKKKKQKQKQKNPTSTTKTPLHSFGLKLDQDIPTHPNFPSHPILWIPWIPWFPSHPISLQGYFTQHQQLLDISTAPHSCSGCAAAAVNQEIRSGLWIQSEILHQILRNLMPALLPSKQGLG